FVSRATVLVRSCKRGSKRCAGILSPGRPGMMALAMPRPGVGAPASVPARPRPPRAGRIRRSACPRTLIIVLTLVGAATVQGASEQPKPVPLTETAGISLTLLDVEVKDEQGRPIKGLKKEDFSVFLGSSEWPIYSVDDFCQCEDANSPPSA